MTKKFTLKRTNQCAKCPWKTSTNPRTIPDGYCEQKHRNLEATIAKGVEFGESLNVMACHHSTPNDMSYCVGWVNNQLNEGNNVGLRILMMSCSNIKDLKTIGRQHEYFEDTFPK